jgi:predicted nucleotidyltransferase
MAITIDEVRSRREAIRRVVDAHGAANPRLFGSVAVGRMDDDSDVDILVDFREPGPEGFAYFGTLDQLERELTQLLGTRVHVTEVDKSSPTGKKILSEALPL